MKPTSLMLATATAMRALDGGAPLLKPLTEKPQSRKRSRGDETESTSSSTSGSDDDESSSKKKCVRWSTVTVYEFGVTIGGSAVPRRGGPSIGLAKKPKTVWSSTVDAIEYETASSDDSDSSVSSEMDKENDAARANRPARRRRVRWFKPLERIQLLTEAGCSEKRIYRTMMESSEIAMSRRLCISVQRDVMV